MKTISDNISEINLKIKNAAERVGRNPADIKLVAVSKRQSEEKIQAAIDAGHRDFGESYGQEFRDKFNDFADDIIWHFIGPLQENKLKYIVGKAHLIHAVSSEKILMAIEKRAATLGIIQDVLIQVKTSSEETKHGLMPHELVGFLQLFKKTPHVRCMGLMTLPPFFDDQALVIPYFKKLVELQKSHASFNGGNINLKHLSMGMSSDFEVAIEMGATIVRVGTAIFGLRS